MINQNGIWSWGHVIYDYRGFFRNMKSLGMNKITIWNDFAPLNAKEILNEAHNNGIGVVWGFSWGWETDLQSSLDLGESRLNKIKDNAIRTFVEQYADICGDGIYFQSFTEHDKREIGGKSVAQAVVELVNSTADALFGIKPDLNIEFGLHATPIKNDLDAIAETDGRITIVWEDIGAFPFSYSPLKTENFDETYELTKRIIGLRGRNEKCGFITKGMTQLDWSAFAHSTAPLIIGESDSEFIKNRQLEKNPLWEEVTKGWRKNLSYAERIFELFVKADNEICVQSLIEDGMFENEIKEPCFIFSRLCR